MTGTRAQADAADPDIVLSLDNVVKRYGVIRALDGVTFDVRHGEMFGLIGPDGAGKTTTIRLLCGLMHPDSGTIRVHGHDPVRSHRAITGIAGYLSQRFSLYGDLSVDENIAFFAEIHGLRDYRARRDRLLEMTQLTPFRNRLADRLSGGMKQKLALACTLVHEPRVVILDEPTTGVDPVSRREFWRLLSQFLAGGITILMSTPYLDEAERCSRVVLLHEGRVLACDEPGRLRASAAGTWFEVVAGDLRAAVAALRVADGAGRVQIFGDRIHVSMDAGDPDTGAQRLRGALQRAGLDAAEVRRIVPSLEDIYIARLAQERAAGLAGHPS
jgi:ABC-2 type transport system ATP-binding protein